ncbi:MAG TPA: ABC transporter permease subunit [Candidatus Sulfotelmatobacter sp.]|jgi:NitT/TauT family transport system permease protein|nr:ABC transporter permease subunit [Candidatus Sulfotelmatobacter sp.]
MKKSISLRGFSAYRLWAQLPSLETSRLPDVIMFAAGIALFYGVAMVGRGWLGPFTPSVDISRSPWALPAYAGYSLLRITIAYLFSLVFAIAYGYVAAYNRRAERFMIPLLDVLQSIPVLVFLPPVMLAMVALFPARQLGVELGAILLIFTGQVWNMAFSFYASLKSIPKEMRETAMIYRFSAWQRFTEMELPFSAIGLVWNSMMSVAGGWFALMVCEMFVLGSRDFRLPGLGSYLQTAASAGDTASIFWGIATMVTVIVLLDQFVWRPVIAWAEKFKVEQVENTDAPRSWVLDFLHHSTGLSRIRQKTWRPLSERLLLHFARKHREEIPEEKSPAWREWLVRLLSVLALIGIGYGIVRVTIILTGLQRAELHEAAVGLGATFLRVNLALLLAALWTVPTGVAIGSNPRLARIAQPLAQIAASVPATALLPVILLVLIRIGGGLGIASIVVLLLGTQWYVLFNVIAGAMAIPTDLKECCSVFRMRGIQRWKKLILPGIFPYLITGMVTASGGAWNASIVAEYFNLKGQIYTTTGLGASISRATDSGNFDMLLAATIMISATVVTVNRLVWRRLYRLAETRFRLET